MFLCVVVFMHVYAVLNWPELDPEECSLIALICHSHLACFLLSVFSYPLAPLCHALKD